jgi:uncharacterized protein
MDELSFLGFDFKPVKLEEPEPLSGFLEKHPQSLSGYTFATLIAWQGYFKYGWALADPDTLLLSCWLEPDQRRQLLQPVGTLSNAISEKILSGAAVLPYPLKIMGVSETFAQRYSDFSNAFTIREDRAVSNYLYSAESLSQLSGRKYSKKRNLLSQATGLYQWEVEPLTGSKTDSCFEVLKSIEHEEHPQMEGMLARELAALYCTLQHFDELRQEGLLIKVDGRPVAFTIFETINPTTAAIHFERALRSYKGLYQVINWETAKLLKSKGFQFINREEDLGDAGLRDAKLSYHPIQIISAFELIYPGALKPE